MTIKVLNHVENGEREKREILTEFEKGDWGQNRQTPTRNTSGIPTHSLLGKFCFSLSLFIKHEKKNRVCERDGE